MKLYAGHVQGTRMDMVWTKEICVMARNIDEANGQAMRLSRGAFPGYMDTSGSVIEVPPEMIIEAYKSLDDKQKRGENGQ